MIEREGEQYSQHQADEDLLYNIAPQDGTAGSGQRKGKTWAYTSHRLYHLYPLNILQQLSYHPSRTSLEEPPSPLAEPPSPLAEPTAQHVTWTAEPLARGSLETTIKPATGPETCPTKAHRHTRSSKSMPTSRAAD